MVFDEYRDDKLTNRFKWNEEWKTDAIFQTDDDIKYSCDLIENTFKLWRMVPNHMVGFAPRVPFSAHRILRNDEKDNAFYDWLDSFRVCRYELMFQTLGGFIHRKYYKQYTEAGSNGSGPSKWPEIRKFVDGNVTAEDITLSVMYSSMMGYAPIAVVVPESEMFDDIMDCQGIQSETMHDNADQKRKDIFVDSLAALHFEDRTYEFRVLQSSTLFVDVMPLSDQTCWLK